MNAQEKAIAWKYIQDALDKIVDPVLKKSMFGEMYARAERYWGYCPSDEKPSNDVELEDWQTEFLEEINVASLYGVSMYDEQRSKNIEKENRLWMNRFVRAGGDLCDLPEDVRCKYVDDLYLDCLFEYGKEIDIQIKNLVP